MSKRKFFALLSLILFLAFIYFSYLVAKETFVQIDFDTTVKIQDRVPHRFDYPFSLLSVFGSAEVSVLIWLLVFFYIFIKRYWLTLVSLSLFFITVMIELFGKVAVYHPGPPFLFFRGVIDFNNFPSHYVHTDYSYPSGHVARTSFLVAFLLTFLWLKSHWVTKLTLSSVLIFYLLAMIISRVYLGEHWATDVVGGFLLGSSLGIFSAVMIPLRQRNKGTPSPHHTQLTV